ncbi:MAG: hypothetical protein K0T99_02395 [Alphaproteobacteria bacterium]|nr:hypothetical protein [Alphaproteobacteria bacterium]
MPKSKLEKMKIKATRVEAELAVARKERDKLGIDLLEKGLANLKTEINFEQYHLGLLDTEAVLYGEFLVSPDVQL